MMLKGQKKKEYQKIYMRNRRKKQVVRPVELDPFISISDDDLRIGKPMSTVDADGNPIPEYD